MHDEQDLLGSQRGPAGGETEAGPQEEARVVFRCFLTLGAARGSCMHPKPPSYSQASCSEGLSRDLPLSISSPPLLPGASGSLSLQLCFCPSRSFSISLSSPLISPSYCAPSPPSPPLSRPR